MSTNNQRVSESGSASADADIDPFGVPDYLQLASFNRRTLLLDVRLADGREGWIEIVDGEAWNARVAHQLGVDALTVLVSERVATISARELVTRPSLRGITIPTHALLLDLARIQDEARRADTPEVSGVFVRPADWSLDDDELEAGQVEARDVAGALRRVLSGLAQPQPEIEAEWLRTVDGEVGERGWLRAVELQRRTARFDSRVYVVGFDDALGHELIAWLADLGIAARCASAATIIDEDVIPALLVQHISADDSDSPFACFDLSWTLRTSNRACAWMVVTDWPTRYTQPLCAALGACAWLDFDPQHHARELAGVIAGVWFGEQRPAMPAHLRALDLVLMCLDCELDATIELLDDDRIARIAIADAELVAAEFETVDGGRPLRGIEAAAAACMVEAPSLAVLQPIPTRERNLPRGLALALAALTRGLMGVSDSFTLAVKEYETNMSSLNNVCAEVVNDIPDALACGVVDLNTGMLMGIHHTISYFTQSYLDAVAAASVDMFRGKNVQRIEKLISKHRGEEIHDAFEEIFISSHSVFHFMKLIADKSAVVVLVTRKTTNQGMGWSALRIAVDDIRTALP